MAENETKTENTNNKTRRKNRKSRRNRRAVSSPAAIFSYELKTDYAQKAHHRYFDRVGGALYQISVLGRKLGANVLKENAIEDLEKKILKTFNGFNNDMQAEIDKLRKQAGNQINHVQVRYNNPVKVEFEISTQLHKVYMDTLIRLDELIMTFDQMTLLFIMATKDQIDESYRWRTNLERTSSKVVTLAGDFRKQLNMVLEKQPGKKPPKKQKAKQSPDIPEPVEDASEATEEATETNTEPTEAIVATG